MTIRNVQLSRVHIGIPVKLLDNARLPEYDDGDAGFTLFSNDDADVVPSGRSLRVRTGVVMKESIEPILVENKIIATPVIKLESITTQRLWVRGDVIDPSFRGEITVEVFNPTEEEIPIYPECPIANAVIYLSMASVSGLKKVGFYKAESNK